MPTDRELLVCRSWLDWHLGDFGRVFTILLAFNGKRAGLALRPNPDDTIDPKHLAAGLRQLADEVEGNTQGPDDR